MFAHPRAGSKIESVVSEINIYQLIVGSKSVLENKALLLEKFGMCEVLVEDKHHERRSHHSDDVAGRYEGL